MNAYSRYRVSRIDGLFSNDLRHSAQNLTGADGGVVWATHESMKKIDIVGIVYGVTQEDLYSAIKELTYAFGESNEEKTMTITLPNADSRSILAKVWQKPEIVLSASSARTANFRLVLICENPYFISNSQLSETVTLATGGGGAIPTSVPMAIGGDTGGFVLINNQGLLIYPTFAITGEIENATIENRTTGQQFQITTTILPGDVYTVTQSTTGLSVTDSSNVNQMINFSGNMIQLVNGENDIRFSASSADGNASLTITYYELFATPIS